MPPPSVWVIFVLGFIPLSESFVAGPFPFMDDVLGTTINHYKLTYSAMCQAAWDWLTEHRLIDPSKLPRPPVGLPIDFCPVDAWYVEMYGHIAFVEQRYLWMADDSKQVDLDSSTKDDPLYHFDDERLADSNRQLINSRFSIVTQIKKGHYDSARTQLAKLLHSLQDFYSHTNWVEAGKTTINPYLGTTWKHSLVWNMGLSPPGERSCTNCAQHLSYEQDKYLTYMMSHHNVIFWKIDFYRRNVFVCEMPPNIVTSKLTSGYYGNRKPVGKCSHGGGMDGTSVMDATGGINKDSDSFLFAPHYLHHRRAATLAFQASVRFLKDLGETLENLVDRDAYGKLLGFRGEGPALAILMDTTGSMGDSIEAAKEWAISLVKTAGKSVSKYILTPFNDIPPSPGFGPYMETSDINVMISWLRGLRAHGGGDEPELCFPALLLTVQKAPKWSKVVVFTDASSHREDLYGQILANAAQSEINFVINRLAFDHQLSNDGEANYENASFASYFDIYRRLSYYTGGLFLTGGNTVYDILNTTSVIELAPVFPKIYILRRDESLTGNNWTFPVSGLLKTLEVVISKTSTLPLSSLRLIDPSGKTLLNNTIVNTEGTVLLRVQSPSAGLWKFMSSNYGSSSFSFIVQGYSQQVLSYDMTTPVYSGRFPGLASVAGNPLSGSTYVMMISSNNPNKTELTGADVVSCADGTVTSSVIPSAMNQTNSSWYCNVTIPDVPFCLQFHGVDSSGFKFTQLSQHQITPTSIKLASSLEGNSTLSLYPGNNLTVHFTVTNLGGADRFQMLAEDTQKFVQSWVPSSAVDISTNGSVNGSIYLHANTNALPGTVSTVQVTATTESSRFQTNFLTILVTVIARHPDITAPNCTVTSTNISQCPLLFPNGTAPLSCNQHAWTSTFMYYDVGSGVNSIVYSNSSSISWSKSPAFNTSLPNTTFHASASASCCISLASLTVIDNAGLFGVCQVAISRALPATTTTRRITTTVSSAAPLQTTTTNRQSSGSTQGSGVSVIGVVCLVVAGLLLIAVVIAAVIAVWFQTSSGHAVRHRRRNVHRHPSPKHYEDGYFNSIREPKNGHVLLY